MIDKEGASVRTRYYERAILLLKRAAMLLIFQPTLISTSDMLADIHESYWYCTSTDTVNPGLKSTDTVRRHSSGYGNTFWTEGQPR